MPYFKRISLRRKLNPLAIGLKSRMDDDETSDFYREILLRGFVLFSFILMISSEISVYIYIYNILLFSSSFYTLLKEKNVSVLFLPIILFIKKISRNL